MAFFSSHSMYFFFHFSAPDTGQLILASNNLRSLPPEIKRLTTLTKLDISKNGIRCTNPGDFSGLPAEIKELTNLTELKISECNLPYIPPAIWTMVQLKVLDISRNKINVLSPDIGELVNLQKLNLQQTNITTLPPEIAYCQELEEILLWGNVIESLPETLPEMLKLRTLAVNYRSFCAQVDSFQESEELLRKGKLTSEHIPLVVFELATLEVLDLENTKINNIPDMSTFALQELYLCKNFLSKVPPSLFNLHHLTILDMSNNLLQQLPEDIARVTSLLILRLSGNKIERIPHNIKDLLNLEELNLADNRIRHIPNTIGELKKLRALFLEKNELSCLPDEICELENLDTLDITENRITALPMKMHQLKNLIKAHSFQKLSKCGLWLYKNPIHSPPPEIWKTERPEKIFEYLKKLAIIKTENLQRQKLLFFGETGCGKTSLINGLVHRKSMMTKGESEKTRVLQQTKWRTDNNVEFMLNDFGGDKAYSIMYPMFADANALVVLVYNHGTYTMETHHQVLGRWLQFLNIHMPGVVVKLVGTHLDTYEEYALEDENGNISEEVSRSVSRSSRSSFSASRSRMSERSIHSSRSVPSAASSVQINEPVANSEVKDSSTTQSRSSSCVSQSKAVAELVKTNVMRQMQTYTETLKHELEDLESKIKAAQSAGKTGQYLTHLQVQRNKVENLLLHPLRIMPDISLVSNNEGLYGVSSFVETLELMVIDKKLFPNAQRSIPPTWSQIKTKLKQHKTYYLPWKRVQSCGKVTWEGKETNVPAEELHECLQHLHNTGEILWCRDTPSLSKIIFHKPRILTELLAAIFRHDIEDFLKYENNKVFLSKGMFSKEDFQNAKELFFRNGQISRPLMNCLWFYEKLDHEQFGDLIDLIPQMDICYSIPEPIMPNGHLYSYPIIVLPWYNQGKGNHDFVEHWNKALAAIHNPATLNLTYVLPLGVPDGLFEKLTAALQTHVTTRVDWKDSVFATTETEIIKLVRKDETTPSEAQAEDSALSVTTKTMLQLIIAGEEENDTNRQLLLRELTKQVAELFSRMPGLVWYLQTSDDIWTLPSLQFAVKSVQFSK